MFSKERLMTNTNTLSQDSTLPKLSIALDPSAMKRVLQNHAVCQGEHPQPIIDHCEIFHTRYKRGRYCLICYRVALHGSNDSHMSEQIFCARMFEQGGAVSRFKKAQSKDLFPPEFGQALSLIPELDMVVWAFPNDRKLSGLPGLMNRDHLRSHIIPLIVSAHLGKNWKIESCTPELVHYVGEHTCTICVSVHVIHTTTGIAKTQCYFGKTYYNNEGEVAYQAMTELWDSDVRRSGRLPMAQPLWYDKELLTLWQCGLKGKTLIEHDLTHDDGLHLLKHAAVTVVTLHHTPVSCAGSHHLEEQLELLGPVCTLLAEVQPQCQALLTRLLDRLRAQAPFVDDQPHVTLHGDLHLQNFFVTPDGVALIDLDNLRTGSPFHDLGSFLSTLYYRALVKGEAPALYAALGDIFLKEYEKRLPWVISRQTLSWFVAVSLVTERAYRCATRLKNGRSDLIPELLALADDISHQGNPIFQRTVRTNGSSNT